MDSYILQSDKLIIAGKIYLYNKGSFKQGGN
jgi:hypothetical protein